MNTGNKTNIPTYSKVRCKYNGQVVEGIVKDNPKRLCLDDEGSIRWEAIEDPVVVYEVSEIHTLGDSGIISLTNGVDINYGPYSQYKTKREAIAFAEAVADLCTGIDISMKEVGKAMQG